ncbi:MAG TPA: YtxH domain-containing protein [Nocardioidaceae bacterium]|nr:YtxH domain-containing protein [Nocardioidaceae bacterium]
MKKLMVLGAGAVGYVLGTRAGRERYEQIARQAQKLRNNPAVQQKVAEAKHTAKDAASAATDKVRGHEHSGPGGVSTGYSAPPTSGATDGLGRGDDGV